MRIASSKLVPKARAIAAATNQKPALQYEKSSPGPTGNSSGLPSVSLRSASSASPNPSSGSGHSHASPPWWLSNCLTVASSFDRGGRSSSAKSPSWTSVIANVAVNGFVIDAIWKTVSGETVSGRPSSQSPSAALTVSPSRHIPTAIPGTFQRSRASAAQSANRSAESHSIGRLLPYCEPAAPAVRVPWRAVRRPRRRTSRRT